MQTAHERAAADAAWRLPKAGRWETVRWWARWVWHRRPWNRIALAYDRVFFAPFGSVEEHEARRQFAEVAKPSTRKRIV